MNNKELEAMGITDNKSYCKRCGKELKVKEKTYCERCEKERNCYEYETSYTGVSIICFLIPLIGFIGYVTHIKNDYFLAKKCLNSSLLGLIIYIIILSMMFL